MVVAQQPQTLSGVVRSRATSRPLVGSQITIVADGESRSTLADERGAFAFLKLKPGTYSLSARRIGYQPFTAAVRVGQSPASIEIVLDRVASLDTVRVPVGTAVYGVVGTARDLRPLRNVQVQVAGSSTPITTDSAGRFFGALKSPGVYMVRARADGYDPQTVSATVRKDEAVELAFLLDTAVIAPPIRAEVNWKEFDERQRKRGARSALVSRAELLKNGNMSLLDALRQSREIGAMGLAISPGVCVLVNGDQSLATQVWALDANEVESVEVYTSSDVRSNSDVSGTLAERTRAQRCAPPGRPGVMSRETARWIVVWMKK